MRRVFGLLEHSVAGGLALVFAWFVAKTANVTTGLQFIAPLAVMLLAHLVWIGLSRGYAPGYATIALSRMLATAVGTAIAVLVAAAVAPMPAEAANLGATLSVIVGLLFCLAVLVAVVVVVAIIVCAIAFVGYKSVRLVHRWLAPAKPPGSGDGRLYDAGLIALAFLVIGTASMEGTTPALSFAAADAASTTVAVAAPPDRVWQQVAKATSPAFPLPAMLKIIPRPVAVLTDEGAGLGARRVVQFAGREGQGALVLQVVKRSDAELEFRAVSDTSPVAKWVRQRALIFHVAPTASGSELTVSLRYDRLLAPAWFFRPFIHTAAGLAMDVLARDTRDRAERQ